jgi:drug/metabolite transporter (DMT)-like permease
MDTRKFLKGIVLCLITVVAYGIQFPIAGHALQWLDPIYFTLIRYGATSILFILLLGIHEGTNRRDVATEGDPAGMDLRNVWFCRVQFSGLRRAKDS